MKERGKKESSFIVAASVPPLEIASAASKVRAVLMKTSRIAGF
jgi:hypothetical protein